MVKILYVISAAVLLVRAIPEIWLDITRSRVARPREAEARTRAKAIYIAIMHYIIIGVCVTMIVMGRESRPEIAIPGLAIFWFGALFCFASVMKLGKSFSWDLSVTREFKLMTTGPYGLVRHPMRVGLMLDALGLVIVSGTPWLLIPWAFMVTVQVARTVDEEKFLTQQVGAEYEEYKKRVPAWNLPVGMWRKVTGKS